MVQETDSVDKGEKTVVMPEHGPWWFEFEERGPACVGTGTAADAYELAAVCGTIEAVHRIGYPARPRLDKDMDGWDHKAGQVPSFCMVPDSCKATGSCVNPLGRSCTS